MKQPSIRHSTVHRCKPLLPVAYKLPLPSLANLVSGCLVLALAACGGGGGGGGNSGQAPDPVIVDLPIAYIQRPIPVDEAGEPVFPDVFAPAAINPGGELYIKARATAQAEVINITRAEFETHLEKYPNYTPENPNYDVKDVSAHPDGSRLIFAMRAPLDPDMDEDEEGQPTWNIWEYHLQSKVLRRVITADFEAEKGHDVAPHYLPDGRILFTSNRQKRSKEILLDEGKPQFGAVTQQDNDITSFLLHSVKEDGTDIQQMTYNQSHDIQPTVMPNGRLLFMRWQGTGQNERLSFYTSNPDGTDIQRYFGYTSLNLEPGDNMAEAPRLFRPQVLPDGRIAAIYLQNTLQLGGDMVVVDGATMAEGEVKSISIKPVDISTDHVSLSGRFAALTPLYDGTNRLLVSWSQCRLQETATGRLQPCLPSLLLNGEPIEGYEEAPPFYGIWIYDIASQTQQPVVLAEDGKVFTEAIALEKLAAPPAYIAPQTDPDLAAKNLGLLHIRSVYDVDGVFNPMGSGVASLAAMAALSADSRPARFVRILKAVSVPNNDVFNGQDDNIYGNLFNANGGIYEILGYTPVEPDGSVMVTVPSDVAFNLEVLDASGRRIIARIDQLISVRPGERLTSNGLAIIGRADLALPSLNTGAATAANFANTQRYLPLGVPATPAMGETMAEFAARTTYCPDFPDGTTCALFAGPGQERNLRNPTVDLIYNDEWSAPSLPRTVSFFYRYNDLDPALTLDTIPAPTPSACRDETSWNANCRVVINYEYHIQPLWERERPAMTETDPATLISITATNCIGCHSNVDTDGNVNARVPSGQLELIRTKAAANAPMRSYPQLTQGNQRQIQYRYEEALATLIPRCELEEVYEWIPQCTVTRDPDGVPTCAGVTDCPFVELDEETGELELDALGNPVPQMVPTPFLPPPMNRAGANSSLRFFDRFAPHWEAGKTYSVGAVVFYDSVPGDTQLGWTFRARIDNVGSAPNPAANQTNEWQRLRQRPLSDVVDHAGKLNDAELKMLSEWLDTDGRYYTNPFELALPN
jgi:hypothetical protein